MVKCLFLHLSSSLDRFMTFDEIFSRFCSSAFHSHSNTSHLLDDPNTRADTFTYKQKKTIETREYPTKNSRNSCLAYYSLNLNDWKITNHLDYDSLHARESNSTRSSEKADTEIFVHLPA